MTLFHLPIPGRTLDTRFFKEVVELKFRNGSLDVTQLDDNEFAVAFFPDIGMTSFSIWLSNLRIAPIQIAGTGHSVSTWGAEIDYYLSGSDVEVPNHPEQHYSERLLLLPGCGAVHERPAYTPTGRTKNVPEFVINCSWSAHKVNYRFLEMMREIVDRSPKKLRLRLLVGASLNRAAAYIPFVREVTAMLPGAVVEVLPNLGYGAYMARMEEGDLGVDAYHYGGCNTVADSLFLRIPIASLEGQKWYNRIGPQMLRMTGLPDLVATSEREYVELVLRLIGDDAYRQSKSDYLKTVDMDATFLTRTEGPYFRKAVDYLIANHESLRKEGCRAPIRIEK